MAVEHLIIADPIKSNNYKALVDHVSLFTNSRLVMMEMPLEGDEGRHSARRPPDMPQTLARLPAFTTFPPCQFQPPSLLSLPSPPGVSCLVILARTSKGTLSLL